MAAERTQWEPENLGSQSKHHWPAPQSAVVEQVSPTWKKNPLRLIKPLINPSREEKKEREDFSDGLVSSWASAAACLHWQPQVGGGRARRGGAGAAARAQPEQAPL